MALISLPILDYSNKDFASIRLRLQGLARSVFPDWTDFNTPNFGNLLVELFAYVGDTITFYQDAQARESFWPTTTRRISAIRHGRLINFKMPGAAPATGTVRFSLPAAWSADIPIQPGTRFSSKDPLDPIPYRTSNSAPLYITTGNTFVDVPVEQTELIENETFESTGAPSQEFVLSRVSYVDGTARPIATDGEYTAIESFLDVTVTNPLRFVELVDQFDRCHLRFGNGVLGKIPTGRISVSYKITRGSVGNVEPGKIGVLKDAIFDVNGAQVGGVTVSSVGEISNGTDRMTVAQARSLGPASLRALTRTVTRSDFETHAQEVPGVARAAMLTSNEDPAVEENRGKLLIVARGARLSSGRYKPATPSQTILDSVKTKVTSEKPATLTFAVDVLAAPFKLIDISTRVHFRKGANKEATCIDIVNALRDLFAATLEDGTPNVTVDFGANILDSTGEAVAEIAWTDVLNAIRDVEGVRKVSELEDGLLINDDPTRGPEFGLRHSISITLHEFPRLNRVRILDAEPGSGVTEIYPTKNVDLPD